MRLDYFLIGMVIFTAFIVTGTLMVGNVNKNYDLNMSTEEFTEVYNLTDDMYGLSESMDDKTLGGEIDDAEPWESMTKGSYKAVRQISSTFDLVRAIINAVSSTLGVPSYFVKLGMAALVIAILFGIIYLFMRVSHR